MTAPLVTPEGPDQAIEESKDFWREVGRNLVRGSAGAMDDVAKQLIAVAGILVGLYFHGVAFTSLHGKVDLLRQAVYLAPIGLLLVTLIFSLGVFWPRRQPVNISAWEAAKILNERIAARKLRAVRLASVFLVLGIVAIGVAMAAYLKG